MLDARFIFLADDIFSTVFYGLVNEAVTIIDCAFDGQEDVASFNKPGIGTETRSVF